MPSNVFFDEKMEHQAPSFEKNVQLTGLPAVHTNYSTDVVLWKIEYPTGPQWVKTLVQ